MRTTLTLENDVSVMLAKLQHELHVPFKKLVNDSIREGLQAVMTRKKIPSKRKFTTQPVSVGEVYISNLDNTSEVLASIEGDLYR